MSEQAKDSYEAPSVEQVDSEDQPTGTAAGVTDTSDQAAN